VFDGATQFLGRDEVFVAVERDPLDAPAHTSSVNRSRCASAHTAISASSVRITGSSTCGPRGAAAPGAPSVLSPAAC
jgi:hypothetical protein